MSEQSVEIISKTHSSEKTPQIEPETYQKFAKILKDCQKDLEKFPADGANYFTFPALPDHLNKEISELTNKDIQELFTGIIDLDWEEKLITSYGPRSWGYLMTNIFVQKQDVAEKELELKTFKLLDESEKSISNNDLRQIPKIFNTFSLRNYMQYERRDFLNGILWEKRGESMEKLEDYLDEIYPHKYPQQTERLIKLLTTGVYSRDIFDELTSDNLFWVFNKANLAPALKALYQREKAKPERYIKTDHISRLALLTITSQVMEGGKIDLDIKQSLNEKDSSLLPIYIIFGCSNVPFEKLNPDVQNFIKETQLDTKEGFGILELLIHTDSELKPGSELYKKLDKLTIDEDLLLGDLIEIGLNVHQGDWNKMDFSTRHLIEKYIFQGYSLESGDIVGILSILAEYHAELPLFLETYFQKPKNKEPLLDATFKTFDQSHSDLYGNYFSYHNLRARVLKEGFNFYPKIVQDIYRANLESIASKYPENVLFCIFPFFEQHSSGYEEFNLNTLIYPNINPEIWSVLEKIEINKISEFLKLRGSVTKNNTLVHETRENDTKKIIEIPLPNILPPEIIDIFATKIFPEWKVTNESIDYLQKLNFVITDRILGKFSEIDRNFLEFFQKYPPLGVLLFKHKDKYFLERKPPEEFITPELIENLSIGIDHWNPTSIREMETIVSTYLEAHQNTLNWEVVKKSIDIRFFPKSQALRILKESEDYYPIFQKLYNQSGDNEWVDVIPNRDLFWDQNSLLLVNLLESGLTNLDFPTFRILANSPNVDEIFKDKQLKISEFANIVKQFSINPHNFSYINNNSLTIMDTYLSNSPEFKIFIRKLLTSRTRSFNNAMLCIGTNSGIDIEDKQVQEEIFNIIDKIGNISPLVLKNYIQEQDPLKKEEFTSKIKIIRERFLLNEPVKNILADFDYGNDVLAELITLSYPGTDLQSVQNLLRSLEDRCEDLNGMKISNDGYTPTITQRFKTAILKEGEQINLDILNSLKEMFPRGLDETTRSNFEERFNKAIVQIIKTRGAISFGEIKENIPPVVSIMYDEEPIQEFRKTVFDFSQPENVTTFLGRITELLGIYFKDNFERKLKETLDKNPELSGRLASTISSDFVNQTTKNMSGIKDSDGKRKLQEVVDSLTESLKNQSEIKNEDLAKLTSIILENRILGGERGLRALIKKEYKKFNFVVSETATTPMDMPQFKGYVSKNVASFFAKTTAGICTDKDTGLFNRPDHFHINLVDENTVIGNIQGYIIEYEGKKALLFRGFNPSASYVNPNNADMVGEGMISIIKKWASENSITDIFISEQTSWHSLTNRVGEGLMKFFQTNYLKPEREVIFNFPVTSSQNISKMYRIT